MASNPTIGALRTLARMGTTKYAWAHAESEGYVYMRADGQRIKGNMQLNVLTLAVALGIEFEPDVTENVFESRRSQILDVFSTCFSLGEGDAALDVSYGGFSSVDTAAGRFCLVEYVTSEANSNPLAITLSIDGLRQIDHHQRVVVVVRSDAGWGRFQRRRREHIRMDEDTPTATITVRAPTLADHLGASAESFVTKVRRRLGR